MQKAQSPRKYARLRIMAAKITRSSAAAKDRDVTRRHGQQAALDDRETSTAGASWQGGVAGTMRSF